MEPRFFEMPSGSYRTRCLRLKEKPRHSVPNSNSITRPWAVPRKANTQNACSSYVDRLDRTKCAPLQPLTHSPFHERCRNVPTSHRNDMSTLRIVTAMNCDVTQVAADFSSRIISLCLARALDRRKRSLRCQAGEPVVTLLSGCQLQYTVHQSRSALCNSKQDTLLTGSRKPPNTKEKRTEESIAPQMRVATLGSQQQTPETVQ